MMLTDTSAPPVARPVSTPPIHRRTPSILGIRAFTSLTGLTSLAILLQAVLAGAFVDKQGGDGLITAHGVVADVAWGLSLLTALVAWRVLRGTERPLLAGSFALFALTLAQTGIGHLITDGGHDGLIAVHVPLAMVIFGLTVFLSIRGVLLRAAVFGHQLTAVPPSEECSALSKTSLYKVSLPVA